LFILNGIFFFFVDYLNRNDFFFLFKIKLIVNKVRKQTFLFHLFIIF